MSLMLLQHVTPHQKCCPAIACHDNDLVAVTYCCIPSTPRYIILLDETQTAFHQLTEIWHRVEDCEKLNKVVLTKSSTARTWRRVLGIHAHHRLQDLTIHPSGPDETKMVAETEMCDVMTTLAVQHPAARDRGALM